jgi:diaminopimelate decarboxylase
VARRYGTPVYAYDLAWIRGQIDRLRTTLPAGVEVLYSLKANPSLGLCGFIAGYGVGADVASAGELVTALEAGFGPGRIFLTGPDKSPAVLELLQRLPEAVVSLDSACELRTLVGAGLRNRALLRLRPDFCSFATCSAGPDSRFGVPFDELPHCRAHLGETRLIGFHVFSGSQVLDAGAVIHHLRGGLDLALRAAEALGVAPEVIDLGGGFGIPYGPGEEEFDLAAVAAELAALRRRAAPARLVVELGRYVVAQAGWYVAAVLARQTHGGRQAVVIDGGSHQRADLCGVGLRRKGVAPMVLDPRAGPLLPTDVLGCLSLPSDVLIEAAPLPPLERGDVLAFPNAGAYGLAASPLSFHAHAAPGEVAFEGSHMEQIRKRWDVRAVLEGQALLCGARARDADNPSPA